MPRKKPQTPEEKEQRKSELAEERALRKLLIEKGRRDFAGSFYQFFKAAWTQSIEPFTEFNDSWHYELLCEYAQLIGTGAFKKRYPDKKGLIICIPPRTLKSNIFTVALQAWTWTHSPYKKFLCFSYSDTLATTMSQKARNLIQDKWYQKRWKLNIKDDANEKDKFANEQGGYRISTGAQATGQGGNVVVLDDMLNARYAFSKARRQAVNKFWDDALTTRRNNPAEDVYLVVMQRVHDNDLVGHLLKKEADEWVVLNIPMEAEETKTYEFPISGKTHTRVKGDILIPEMNDAKYIRGQKRNMKVWNAQFQQKPSPPGGFIFNPDKWNFYDVVSTTEKKVALPDPDFQVLSVDCAWKSGQDNDKVALMVMGVEGPRKYILDYRHEHMNYVQILEAIRDMRKKYPKISFVLVEKAANGEAVIKQLSEEMGGMVGVLAKEDKESRAHSASADLDSGQCFLPNPEQESRYQTDIIDDFAHFNGDGTLEWDDLVDTFTQAINWLREKFWSTEHLDKAYKEVTEGKNMNPQTGENCPGCGKINTIVREGTSWMCKSCGSSGHGGKRRITKQGM